MWFKLIYLIWIPNTSAHWVLPTPNWKLLGHVLQHASDRNGRSFEKSHGLTPETCTWRTWRVHLLRLGHPRVHICYGWSHGHSFSSLSCTCDQGCCPLAVHKPRPMHCCSSSKAWTLTAGHESWSLDPAELRIPGISWASGLVFVPDCQHCLDQNHHWKPL